MAEEEFHIPMIRMEEEEYTGGQESRQVGFGAAHAEPQKEGQAKPKSPHESIPELIGKVIKERETILSDKGITPKERLNLLESNHRALLTLSGRNFKSFKTEQVVYWILGFSAVVLITLACLNVWANLPTEITLAFLGTTLGGTIATIAQKLGRI